MTIKTFNDFREFEAEAEKAGVQEDLRALLALDANFLERYRNYVVVNIKDYDEERNNLLLLSYETSMMYSGKQFSERDFSLYRYTLRKKFGESTVLMLLALRKVLQNYSQRFEKLNEQIYKLEETPDIHELQDVSRHLRKLTDRVEDFSDVLIKLEERNVREVNTHHVRYDWDLLTAEGQHLVDRCRRRLAMINGLRSEVDIKTLVELNVRIDGLTETMKKLTAMTIILAIPAAIATHFGMNFHVMPELAQPWGYSAAVMSQVLLTIGAALYFKYKGYL